MISGGLTTYTSASARVGSWSQRLIGFWKARASTEKQVTMQLAETRTFEEGVLCLVRISLTAFFNFTVEPAAAALPTHLHNMSMSIGKATMTSTTRNITIRMHCFFLDLAASWFAVSSSFTPVFV
eukprot:COSAG02_NODE_8307_length_2623_cov_2.335578_2_plen_125_part_00